MSTEEYTVDRCGRCMELLHGTTRDEAVMDWVWGPLSSLAEELREDEGRTLVVTCEACGTRWQPLEMDD